MRGIVKSFAGNSHGTSTEGAHDSASENPMENMLISGSFVEESTSQTENISENLDATPIASNASAKVFLAHLHLSPPIFHLLSLCRVIVTGLLVIATSRNPEDRS